MKNIVVNPTGNSTGKVVEYTPKGTPVFVDKNADTASKYLHYEARKLQYASELQLNNSHYIPISTAQAREYNSEELTDIFADFCREVHINDKWSARMADLFIGVYGQDDSVYIALTNDLLHIFLNTYFREYQKYMYTIAPEFSVNNEEYNDEESDLIAQYVEDNVKKKGIDNTTVSEIIDGLEINSEVKKRIESVEFSYYNSELLGKIGDASYNNKMKEKIIKNKKSAITFDKDIVIHVQETLKTGKNVDNLYHFGIMVTLTTLRFMLDPQIKAKHLSADTRIASDNGYNQKILFMYSHVITDWIQYENERYIIEQEDNNSVIIIKNQGTDNAKYEKKAINETLADKIKDDMKQIFKNSYTDSFEMVLELYDYMKQAVIINNQVVGTNNENNNSNDLPDNWLETVYLNWYRKDWIVSLLPQEYNDVSIYLDIFDNIDVNKAIKKQDTKNVKAIQYIFRKARDYVRRHNQTDNNLFNRFVYIDAIMTGVFNDTNENNESTEDVYLKVYDTTEENVLLAVDAFSKNNGEIESLSRYTLNEKNEKIPDNFFAYMYEILKELQINEDNILILKMLVSGYAMDTIALLLQKPRSTIDNFKKTLEAKLIAKLREIAPNNESAKRFLKEIDEECKRIDLYIVGQKKQKAGNNKKKITKIIQCDCVTGNEIKSFKSAKDAAQEVGISASAISQCVSGKRKNAGGYAWKKIVTYEDITVESVNNTVKNEENNANNEEKKEQNTDVKIKNEKQKVVNTEKYDPFKIGYKETITTYAHKYKAVKIQYVYNKKARIQAIIDKYIAENLDEDEEMNDINREYIKNLMFIDVKYNHINCEHGKHYKFKFVNRTGKKKYVRKYTYQRKGKTPVKCEYITSDCRSVFNETMPHFIYDKYTQLLYSMATFKK